MNWTGIVFGLSLVLALIGTIGATFAERSRHAVLSLAAAMLGVGGVCLALGNDFVAVVVVALLATAVPAVLLAALLLAPTAEPDVHGGRARNTAVAAGMTFGFALLGLVITMEPWVPPGGSRQQSIEWLGSRLLTDHLLTFDLVAALLALATLGVVALLRGRREPR